VPEPPGPPRPHPLLIALAALIGVALVGGVAYERLQSGGGNPSPHSVTEHAGTLHFTPRALDPEPALADEYWTWAYPAAYSPRVRPGVGVYAGERRIGYVHAKRVDHGTVWVYTWIAPGFEDIAAGATETEPIETAEGPRIEIFKYQPRAPVRRTDGAGVAA
jgi:hypothetical protein